MRAGDTVECVRHGVCTKGKVMQLGRLGSQSSVLVQTSSGDNSFLVGKVTQVNRLGTNSSVVVQTPTEKVAFFGNDVKRLRVVTSASPA
jgi:hypothetical protein